MGLFATMTALALCQTHTHTHTKKLSILSRIFVPGFKMTLSFPNCDSFLRNRKIIPGVPAHFRVESCGHRSIWFVQVTGFTRSVLQGFTVWSIEICSVGLHAEPVFFFLLFLLQLPLKTYSRKVSMQSCCLSCHNLRRARFDVS